MKRIVILIVVIITLFIIKSATCEILLELNDIRFDGITAKGFEIDQSGEIDIEAIGMSRLPGNQLNVYSWIINADSRDLIWVMKSSRTNKIRGEKLLRKTETAEIFEKGRYELYIYAGDTWDVSISNAGDIFRSIGDWLDGDFNDDDDNDELEDKLEECYVRLSSEKLFSNNLTEFEVTGEMDGALVSFTKIKDDAYIEQPFSLDSRMKIRIYTLLESPRGNKEPVDKAWILDAKTREQIWSPDRWNSERAGGGRKNRLFNDEVYFEPGDYVLYYATDDSHSFEDFNVAPPYDPFNWGVTLLPGEDFNPSAFHLTKLAEKPAPLIDFTRARNNDYMEQGFEINKPMTLEINAIGEASLSSHELADFGWVDNAKTGETVWEQTYGNCTYAGGAKKNRAFNGTIDFKKGKYIAYYITDDSHSYRKWNSDRPYNPRSYGMAIYPTSDFNKNDFKLIDAEEFGEQEGLLVKMVRLGNNELETETFDLKDRTRIRIYAIGEGTNGSMYDYGWISNNETDDVIWEMTWRKTKPAGGADKNRKFNGTILLEPGSYKVHYESDGSHSYGNWNASRPRDALNWGITLVVDESKLTSR